MTVILQPEQESLKSALTSVSLPELPELNCLEALSSVQNNGDGLSLTFTFGYPCRSRWPELEKSLRNALAPVADDIQLQFDWSAPSIVAKQGLPAIEGVKNIIAVASGKGGVGKSTTAVNVALALAAEGAKVGVLDADIYGPSQALMLGAADQRPEMYSAKQMKPISALNSVVMMSMGNLVTENTPMVWRGPMVSGALQQLLTQTHWGQLDYLIVDMPPGTGDIQLTLSQSVPVSAAVIVTTPQDIALLDARKGIEMFQKVHIPVVGVVENMSLHTCSNCGHQEAIFGTHGGDKLAEEYGVSVLGRLPLDIRICEMTDRGNPPVHAEPDSAVAKEYLSIARSMAAHLWQTGRNRSSGPTIRISDD